QLRENSAIEQCAVRLVVRNAQVRHTNLTAHVRTVEGVKAGLRCQKGDGVGGAEGGAHHRTAVGVQAAGNVECQPRRGDAVGLFDQLRQRAGDDLLEADAEQAVDHQIVVHVAGYDIE